LERANQAVCNVHHHIVDSFDSKIILPSLTGEIRRDFVKNLIGCYCRRLRHDEEGDVKILHVLKLCEDSTFRNHAADYLSSHIDIDSWSDRLTGISAVELIDIVSHCLDVQLISLFKMEQIQQQQDVADQNLMNAISTAHSHCLNLLAGDISGIFNLLLDSSHSPYNIPKREEVARNIDSHSDGHQEGRITYLSFPGIAGQYNVKQLLSETVLWPRLFASLYRQYSIKPNFGILLYGPPGEVAHIPLLT
jgi:hypothetical protein